MDRGREEEAAQWCSNYNEKEDGGTRQNGA